MQIGDLLSLCLKDAGVLGVGQPATAEDLNDALLTLNMMLDAWRAESLMCYGLTEVSVQCTGAPSYTVGPGMTLDTAWPERIDSAFTRFGNIDRMLTGLSKHDFDSIMLKTVTTIPQYFYYDRAYPVGNILLYPIAPANCALHISVWTPITQFQAVGDTVAFPPGYLELMRYSLGERLATMYLLPSGPTAKLAAQAKRRVQLYNTPVSRLNMPGSLQTGRFAGPGPFLSGQ